MNERSAVPRSRPVWFWLLAIGGLTADLWAKHWMFSQPELLVGRVMWLWPSHAGFQLSLNEGALFGMGQGNVWLFAAFSIGASIAIPVWLFRFGAARDALLTIVLGCILGGVLGNLFDRVGLPGLRWETLPPHLNPNDHGPGPVYAVRDFILVARHWPPRDRWDVWPNFNIADSLLVGGATSLFLLSLRKPPKSASAMTASSSSTPRPA